MSARNSIEGAAAAKEKAREINRRASRKRNQKPERKAYMRSYGQALHRTEWYKEKARARIRKLKEEAIGAYSDGLKRCCCPCGCMENNLYMLTLDHVDNNGAAHRKNLRQKKGGKQNFYQWLKKQGWPNDPRLRVLCWNCNMGKRDNQGRCPRLGDVGRGSRRRFPQTKQSSDSASQFSGLFDGLP